MIPRYSTVQMEDLTFILLQPPQERLYSILVQHFSTSISFSGILKCGGVLVSNVGIYRYIPKNRHIPISTSMTTLLH